MPSPSAAVRPLSNLRRKPAPVKATVVAMDGQPTSATVSRLDIRARLDSIRKIRDGWLEGGGLAPSPDGLDWLAETFAAHYPDDCPRPYLYPTEDGGVQAEWSLAPWSVSWEINLESRLGEWFALNLTTDQSHERQLRCDAPADWEWLVRQIRDMSTASE